jgi:hypothetical protein
MIFMRFPALVFFVEPRLWQRFGERAAPLPPTLPNLMHLKKIACSGA